MKVVHLLSSTPRPTISSPIPRGIPEIALLAEWSRSRGVVQLKLAGSFCVLIGLGIVSGISFVAGCNSPPRLTSQQAEGKHLYEIRCAHCHRENDLALKKVPPDLHSVFKRSTMPSGVAATDAEMRRVVLAGKGMMPAFAGRFTEEQMAALIAYLRTGLQ